MFERQNKIQRHCNESTWLKMSNFRRIVKHNILLIILLKLNLDKGAKKTKKVYWKASQNL